ncbi:methyl-accepting chemotaxis protein [Pseudomonas mandelii]|uniref:methyl-accepting chemotaxis protein n=1 Tax=Pseudomonas mandelii TaxID=75612 RepID=UPI00224B1216|nr:methyl-accepting chemotaxis protein [Pseudomonas mandelii]MCX2901025.1 methyl-accepting chemotaxis protein [Pseudomonas mandelii]
MANSKEQTAPVAQQEIPISRLDTRGHLLACNEAYLALSGYARKDLLNQPHELINHPQMPKQVIERMWTTLRSGVPWTAPVMGRSKQGATFWCNLYVVPLLEDGELNALGTAYHPMSDAQCLRAQQLYRRLHEGHGPLGICQRLQEHASRQGIAWLLGLGVTGALLGGQVALTPGLLLLGGVIGAAWQWSGTLRADARRIMARHDQVYSDSLLAPLQDGTGSIASRFDMALNSQNTRMRTVMARIRINGETVRQRAQESSMLVQAQSGHLQRQLEEAEQSAAAVHQMSATIQELSRNLQHTAQATQAVDHLAHDGVRLSGQSQGSMTGLCNSVEEIGLAVSRLAESIESISGVANVIRSIAEQTNLLALNAAIEAARAGESGRGFAVVADEVRSLATRTRESTEQIQRSIEHLRDGSTLALATAQRGECAARESRADVAQVQTALQRICEEVGQISGMSLQMASAIEQQGQVAQEINGQIAQIVSLAQTSRDESRRNTQIGEELHQLANSQLDLAQRFVHG